MNSKTIEHVFIQAAVYNIAGILIFTKLFTNSLFFELDPEVFSIFGAISIILWGAAYGSVAQRYQNVSYLLLVFFIEKMFYAANWVNWLLTHSDLLPNLYAESVLTALFYSIYGLGDFIFGLFFLWVAISNQRAN